MKPFKAVSDIFIIRSQYFLYFGTLGIFLPYFNLYCFHLGFSGFEIGTLTALRSVALVLFPLIWGALADRFNLRRSIYIGCAFVSAGIWAFYLLTTEFWPMLLITVVYGIFFAPIISFLEAFTMDVLGRRKKSYGSTRAWGSVSFIVMVLTMGAVIKVFSVDIIVVCILAGSLMLAASSARIPARGAVKKEMPLAVISDLLHKKVVLFLVCAFLMLVSHGAYYGFFSIHLETLGFESTFIGLAWALASTAEILVMLRSDQIFNRFSLENVLALSFMAAALRWIILFWAQSAALILLSQLLHAVTYGAFHMASILYIDRLAPARAKTLGQALNNATTYGLGLMVGFFLNGYLYEIRGSAYLFIVSSLTALAAAMIFSAFRIRQLRPQSLLAGKKR